MLKSLTLSILLILSLSFKSFSQNERLDSLLLRLQIEQIDSIKLNLLIEISRYYYRDIRQREKCETVLEQALEIASRDSNLYALAQVFNNYGVLYRNIALYDLALENHDKALFFALKTNDNQLISSTNNNIGVVYRRMDNHPRAALFHLAGLKAAEIINDTYNISVSLNSLGNIYSLNGQYPEAFSYFKRALKIARDMNNKLGQAINYNNIGEVFEFMGVLDSAYVYYVKSLEANQSLNSQKGIAISYNAIGKILLYQGKVNEAYNLFSQALIIDKKLGDKKFIADSYINLGRVFIEMNRLNDAEESSRTGLQISEEIGSILHSQWAYENLSKIYSKRKNHELAFDYFKKATLFKDSLINVKNSRAIAMMEVMYETDKKEQQIQILQQTQEINQKEIARQRIIRNFYLAGLIFAFFLALSIFYGFNVKRKANRVLTQQKSEIEKSHSTLSIQQKEILKQNREIEQQRHNIELKNKYLEDAYRVIEGYIGKITDSIRYAERIQQAILPPLSISKGFFSDSFFLYKPKDFVSGDFYWLTVKEQTLFLAVADCTGHGVPGAFMSIIGMDLLSQAVTQQNINEPSKILDFINVELRNKLRKEDEEELILKDSMDIAVIKINFEECHMTYSGALIPITIIRKGKIIEHKPDYASIGISSKLFNRPFNQEIIDIMPNDWIYIYTDGFMDQFGGESNKKFMRSRFFSALVEASRKNGVEQKNELKRIFSAWKGNNEQIDDVLVLGLKV
jgi:serine phosphatase RsbU (regulator of sigma subunit)/Tfp pilus assembly protein PilF